MWLFTRYGFYSVACGQRRGGAADPNTMMIRARSIDHLQNLKARFPALANNKILRLVSRDYRWLLIIPKEVWVPIVTQLAQEQEWSSFQNEVALYQGIEGFDYSNALHEVWSVMYGFQTKADLFEDERNLPEIGTFERLLRDYKVKLALQAIEDCKGNKTLAANSLGISRTYLHRLIRLRSRMRSMWRERVRSSP